MGWASSVSGEFGDGLFGAGVVDEVFVFGGGGDEGGGGGVVELAGQPVGHSVQSGDGVIGEERFVSSGQGEVVAVQLKASPSTVELLFTSYLVITAVAMLVTGWVSSRIGAKRTLISGLVLIVVFSAAGGASGSIGQIIGFRAGWGLGNALFIATSLAVIVAAASGGFAGAIVLYETALGVGIALGPLVGGELGGISWRGPFFGVAVLMTISLVAIIGFLDSTPPPARTPSTWTPSTWKTSRPGRLWWLAA